MGFILTLIVWRDFVISSRLIVCVFVKDPLVSLISAGDSIFVAMLAFPVLSHFQCIRYQKHFGRERLPPVEWSFLSKSCAISCSFLAMYLSVIIFHRQTVLV